MIFHRHHWTETERLHAEPAAPGRSLESHLSKDLDRWLFGVTTIILRCECGDLKTVEVLGK